MSSCSFAVLRSELLPAVFIRLAGARCLSWPTSRSLWPTSNYNGIKLASEVYGPDYSYRILSQNIFYHLAVYIRQAEATSLVLEGQSLVIDT